MAQTGNNNGIDPNVATLYKPVIYGEYPIIRFDHVSDGSVDTKISIFEDIYKLYFNDEEHYNFIGTNDYGPFVISVLGKIIPGSFPPKRRALKTYDKGYCEFTCVLKEGSIPIVGKIQQYLQMTVLNTSLYPISDQQIQPFNNEFLQFEQNNSQKISTLKVGVIYSKKGQISPGDMLKNSKEECSKEFIKFLSVLGEEINLEGWVKYAGNMKPPGTTLYTEWQHIEG